MSLREQESSAGRPASQWRQAVAEVLLDEAALRQRVRQLGQEITQHYQGHDLLLVGVLKGALLFLSDLMRHIDLPLTIDYVSISSYGAATQSSGVVRILKDLDSPVAGRHLLVVEDVIDSGLTVDFLCRNLARRQPASLEVCGLLYKEKTRSVDLRPRFIGFRIPDRFVVGYGLDYAERFRNLPYIGVLRTPASVGNRQSGSSSRDDDGRSSNWW